MKAFLFSNDCNNYRLEIDFEAFVRFLNEDKRFDAESYVQEHFLAKIPVEIDENHGDKKKILKIIKSINFDQIVNGEIKDNWTQSENYQKVLKEIENLLLQNFKTLEKEF